MIILYSYFKDHHCLFLKYITFLAILNTWKSNLNFIYSIDFVLFIAQFLKMFIIIVTLFIFKKIDFNKINVNNEKMYIKKNFFY